MLNYIWAISSFNAANIRDLTVCYNQDPPYDKSQDIVVAFLQVHKACFLNVKFNLYHENGLLAEYGIMILPCFT